MGERGALPLFMPRKNPFGLRTFRGFRPSAQRLMHTIPRLADRAKEKMSPLASPRRFHRYETQAIQPRLGAAGKGDGAREGETIAQPPGSVIP